MTDLPKSRLKFKLFGKPILLKYYILLEIGFVETNGELKKKITERWGNVSQHLDILAASKKREML